ncbi:MAG: DinB family protein [Acidobacteria bacterium]|nr:MAG: DinB family protein [Acidobacteriota bacterium]
MAENKVEVEPWVRGTHEEVPVVLRAVIHLLELAREDVRHWCSNLTDEEWNLSPDGLTPVAVHVRHMARSIDRLLTYAEGSQLSREQLDLMKGELEHPAKGVEVLAEFEAALTKAEQRIRAFAGSNLEEKRGLGRKALPTSVGGLLIHVADHTSRHLGQVVTTAKLVTTREVS